jgi:hypothetical protein
MEEYREELRNMTRGDIDMEIDTIDAVIKQAGRMKGAKAAILHDDAKRLREDVTEKNPLEEAEPS